MEFGPSGVSLRLGRAHVPATRCVAFHYARVATLRRSLQPKYQPPHRICRGDHNVFEENLRLAKWSSAQRKPQEEIILLGLFDLIELFVRISCYQREKVPRSEEDEVLISLCYGLLIHRKRSPFPRKGRLDCGSRFIIWYYLYCL